MGGHFDAELRFTSGAMYLSVRDWGPGFDVERAMKTYGPGLISMTERLELVGEHLSIDSQSQCGTTVHARAASSKVSASGELRNAELWNRFRRTWMSCTQTLSSDLNC